MDQDGDVLYILVTRRRDKRAAVRFLRTVLKQHGSLPLQLVTDKLRSYPAAQLEGFPLVGHRTGQHENNRAEVSHQHTREGTPDATLQISGPDAPLPLGPQSDSQPVPTGPSSSQGDPPPTPSRASFHRVEDGNVCLLNEQRRRRLVGHHRTGSVNMTMPFKINVPMLPEPASDGWFPTEMFPSLPPPAARLRDRE